MNSANPSGHRRLVYWESPVADMKKKLKLLAHLKQDRTTGKKAEFKCLHDCWDLKKEVIFPFPFNNFTVRFLSMLFSQMKYQENIFHCRSNVRKFKILWVNTTLHAINIFRFRIMKTPKASKSYYTNGIFKLSVGKKGILIWYRNDQFIK